MKIQFDLQNRSSVTFTMCARSMRLVAEVFVLLLLFFFSCRQHPSGNPGLCSRDASRRSITRSNRTREEVHHRRDTVLQSSVPRNSRLGDRETRRAPVPAHDAYAISQNVSFSFREFFSDQTFFFSFINPFPIQIPPRNPRKPSGACGRMSSSSRP